MLENTFKCGLAKKTTQCTMPPARRRAWGPYSTESEDTIMGHFVRLHLIGRVTYYAGWIALACGGLVHLNIARALFLAMSMSKRNLFELSVVCFLICIASELRALALKEEEVPREMSTTAKRQAAA